MKTKITDDRLLKRVRYESSGGSMEHHSEFEVEADADEVIRAAYWSDYCFDPLEEEAEAPSDGRREMTVKEHIPMNKELWDALTEEIEYLKEQLKPVDTLKSSVKLPEDVFVLDGGDYSRLYLTWDTEGEVQYYSPSGNRWWSVIQILREMARPVGRDLRRIGETVMTGFYFQTPKYSYQITPVGNGGEYYFFVHGDESDISRLFLEQWAPVREYLSGLDFSEHKAGKRDSKYSLRMNFNDGINIALELDKSTSEMIRKFIRRTVLGE
ncbi:hypothetical protein SAMN02910317_00374 [Ruminococcaceae bacterium FB2012]|nr:hypothetical protein SAMN02910317_00374 [Ruminococcaceae bacterium FB2012]